MVQMRTPSKQREVHSTTKNRQTVRDHIQKGRKGTEQWERGEGHGSSEDRNPVTVNYGPDLTVTRKKDSYWGTDESAFGYVTII